MNPRRDELQRQRDLIARHLAWLDGELAALPPNDAAAAIQPTARPPSAANPEIKPPDSFSPDSGSTPWAEMPPPDTQPLSRTGCWLAFSLLMAVGLALATWALYAFYGPREPAQQSSLRAHSYQHIWNC